MVDPPAGWALLAACNGMDGEVYYILGSPGNAGDNESTVSMTLFRASVHDGTVFRQEDIKTEASSDGIDVYEIAGTI